MWKIVCLAIAASVGFATAAQAACDCGADSCQGRSINYPAPSWSPEPSNVSYNFTCNGGDCSCGQYINGDYWIVDSNLKFSSITPNESSGCHSGSTCRNGYEVNPSDNVGSPYDDRAPNYDSDLHGPPLASYDPAPGDQVVKTVSRSDNPGDGSDFSVIERAVIVSVVGSAPSNPHDLFRPPYWGPGEPSRQFRWSDLDFSKLPGVDGSCCTRERPGFDDIRDRFRYVQLDHWRDYRQQWNVAVDNHYWKPEGFNSTYDMERERHRVASVLRFMLDDVDIANSTVQQQAMVNLLQAALDMYWFIARGGEYLEHGRGRQAHMLLAAALWDDDNIRATVRSTSLQHSRAFAMRNGRALWVSRGDCTEQQYWAKFPSTSGACPDPYGRWDAGPVASYLQCCNAKAAQHTVLAGRMLGEEGDLQQAQVEFADRWRTSGYWAPPDNCSGPGTNNAPNCADTGTCTCSTGGTPRQHSISNGSYADSGFWFHNFAEDMWDTYHAFQASGGGGGGTPPPPPPPGPEPLAAPNLIDP